MTKQQLILALQRIPDEADLLLSMTSATGVAVTLALDHVELDVRAVLTLEPSNAAETWQQLLGKAIKVVLVGKKAEK